MPELPEVETTLRGLERHIGQTPIAEVEVIRRDLRWPIAEEFEEVLTSQHITGYRRRGKYFILDVSNGMSLLGHLGMSGTFRVEPQLPETLRKHDHVVITLESAEAAIFHDPRRFGFLLLSPTETLDQHPRLIQMGPDPFDETRFTPAYLKAALSRRKGPIKAALLDQKLVAGVGNIYASEALFLTKLHPLRSSNKLKNKEIDKLIEAIRQVLQAAIRSGGSTLRDFSGADGGGGYFQHHFEVYGKAGQPCSGCGNPLQVESIAGRSSFFCKNCQK